MITPISTLKRRFANFLKPTQEHFWAWMDSYWHKDENIPKEKIEGLSTALEGTASAEQLRNHLTDSQAHSELFDHKVDKEAGKTLTSNDYTNEEKRTNQANAQKRVVGLTVTGDVDKIITITFADSTVLQAPFTDNNTLPENLADIKLNSLNFNEQTGVLTGVRSDGQQLTVSLDGRYALLGHTHPEYALRTHRHNWDDIDGKPEMVTEGKIQEAIGKIQVGGRNLLLMSKQRISNSAYLIAAYTLTEQLREGDQVTMTLKGQLGAGKSAFSIHNSNGYVHLVTLESKGNGLYQATFNWTLTGYGRTADNTFIQIYTINSATVVDSTIEWVKLERGNTPTDWSPAPEDSAIGLEINGTRQILPNEADKVIFVTSSIDNCALNVFPDKCSVTFRKIFDGGYVNFTCLGKQIIYTGDNAFNGGDGSTAVVSIWNNKCYIDIRNI